jgi:DsbC/DsbD-like thiol-disulfide interchange protein
MRKALLIMLAATAFASTANAGSSQWTKTPGGAVRLIVEEPAAGARAVRGALQINLDPGWKTYWREPGDAGVPPQLDLSQSANIAGHELSFPAPHRFKDGASHWAGYKKPVFLPVSITLADTSRPAHIKGHAFLGICETVCIPVTAEFDVAVGGQKSDPLTDTLVDTAFQQLPAPASDAFGISSGKKKGDVLYLTVKLPSQDPAIDLFAAGQSGITLGMAHLKKREGAEATFAVPVLSGKDRPAGVLDYTLVQGQEAVSGHISIED